VKILKKYHYIQILDLLCLELRKAWQYKDKVIFGALRFIEYAPQGVLRFCLLTNFKEEGWNEQRVVTAYLEHWPFPEKSYQRLLEKIIRL